MSKQSGLSLIELMIAMVIGLVLMLGVTQVFLSTRQVYSNQEAVSRVQETGRMAMEFMTRDTRMAGYVGCASGSAVSGAIANLISPVTVLNSIDVGIQGVDGGAAVPAGYGLTGATARVANTDILVIRGALGSGVPLTSTNSATTISVNVPSPTSIEVGACAGGTSRVSGICAGDFAAIADCSKSRIFQVNSISNAGVISFTPNANLAAGIFNASGPGVDGAEVALANTVVYYIGTNQTTLRQGLWQRYGNNVPVELLEGIQDMQVSYGVDPNFPASAIPGGVYLTATQVTAANAWTKVVSVRIELIVASIDDNVSTEVQQPFAFNGGTYTPADHRLRQVVVSTIGIRVRMKL